MQTAEDQAFALVRSRWRVALPYLAVFVLQGLLLAYLVAIDVTPYLLVVYVVGIGAYLLLMLFFAIRSLVTRPARFTRDGVELRRTVPWSEVRHVSITYFGRLRYLAVQAVRRERPYLLPMFAGNVGRQQVDDALRHFSDGAVSLADGPPTWSRDWEPETKVGPGRARNGYGRERKYPLAVYLAGAFAGLLVMPFLAGAQLPWNQPWMPGVTSATHAPDPCAVLDGDLGRRIGVAGGGLRSGSRNDQQCAFTGFKAMLTVRITVVNSYTSSSAGARTLAGERLGAPGTVPIPGLGDEARISSGANEAHLVARKANTVVELLCRGGRDVEALLQVARNAVNAVDAH